MPHNNTDFLDSLKVSENDKEIDNMKEPSSNRDVYTCIKLMQDTSKVQNFLLSASKQKVDDKSVSTDISTNYFYNVLSSLGYAEFDFRKNRIDIKQFNDRIDNICKSQNLDFDYLMTIVDQISYFEKNPNRNACLKLAQDIEARAIEEHEKRKNPDKEK